MVSGLDVLEGLNPPQREAVQTVDGPLLIVAGPGSGKTRVITHRIAHLVRYYDVWPHRIAAVTFTNKAAREMRDRLQRLAGPRAHSLTVGTFHAFCARLLRDYGETVGLNPNYSIYDSDDQLSIIKEAMQLAELDPKNHPPRAIQSVISKAKSRLMDAHALRRNASDYFEEVSGRVYYHYEELLARNAAVDFDDLLLKAVQTLQTAAAVREHYQQRYRFLMIDEFQDTNVAQYRLSQLLTGAEHNICVVGDPDQSIYSWRNADIRNILSFQQDYPEAKTIALEQNYRSTATILEAAKSLISANGIRLEKDLFTENPQGNPVVVHEAYDADEEAAYVVSEIERLVRGERMKAGDCAVMYRVNAQSRALEEACLHLGLKYRLVGGVRFYHRREVKDLLAYLHFLQNPLDEVNLSRLINVPPRGIGAKTLQDLRGWAQEQNLALYTAMQQVAAATNSGGRSPVRLAPRAVRSITAFVTLAERLIEVARRAPVVQLIDLVLEESGLRHYIQNSDDAPEERWDNLQEVRQLAQEFNAEDPPNGLASLLERVSLVAEVDGYEDADDSLTLITLHQAKGLEFPVVFITGLEEGLLPHVRSMDSQAELEEERRLCYVGITRAMERLYLLRAFRRGVMGSNRPTLASRFLAEIPTSRLIAASQPDNWPSSPHAGVSQGRRARVVTQDPWRQTSGQAGAETPSRPTLKVGDNVRHRVFGEGVVLEYTATDTDYEITVEFAEVGQKRLLLSLAPLEKVEA